MAEKKRDELFNKEKPIIPRLAWKEKRVSKEGNAVANNSVDAPAGSVDAVTSYSEDTIHNSEDDDMVDDKADGVNSEGSTNSENGDNTFTDMDINMVFALPAEFRAPESEVAELVLGPSKAMFEKPEKPDKHLKPLFIRGHIDGKPIGRMLVDGGAGVNIMPLLVFSKMNRKESELMRTNMGLSGFSGELSEAKGVISIELIVGSKTLPTAFFVVDVKGRYNVQCLTQWVNDDVEVIGADD